VYFDILSALTGATTLLNRTIHMSTGQTETVTVPVPQGQSSVNFLVTWPGSSVETALIDPAGRTIAPGSGDPNVYYARSSTSELYRITGPAAGNWRMRMYGRALRAGGEDVTALVAARSPERTCAAVPSGAVSWWPGNGNTDDLVDGNPGALRDAAGYAAGMVDRGFIFDGRSEVRVNHNPNLNLQTFTFEAWVFPTLLDGRTEIILNKEQEVEWRTTTQYELGVRGLDDAGRGTVPAGNFMFYLGGITGGPQDYYSWIDAKAPLPLNTWTHVAVAFEGGAARAYVNGELTRSVSGLAGSIKTSTGPLKIGARSDDNAAMLPQDQFNGLIDEMTIYGRALSGSEIRAIYDARRSGKCTP
jgi:hypothetical protein